MKVLFSALHFASFRNFESVVRALAERGHRVHLLADEAETFGGQALVERLASEYEGVTWGFAPSPTGEPWFPVARKLRFALDYVRFLRPRYNDSPKLRLRNIERTPRIVRWLTPTVAGRAPTQRLVEWTLKWLERLMPTSPDVEGFLEREAPDVLLLASLTFSRSLQMEQLKAARARGIPVAACIMSWDHLSSKALLHIAPDLTLVWNGVQKQEAVEMHRLAAERVVVTGAQCYDQWFDRQPSRTRDEFCREVGLDPRRPFVLYVCSAMSPVPDPVEPVFVKEWIQALRASADPALRTAGILVRPHPERVKEWQGVDLDGLENVVVHGRTPIEPDAKSDYFDTLYFSGAVIGLCTSAFLEAAIVGRPVLTLLLPAFRIHQDGMAHFRYLLNVEGGLLRTAVDLPAHVDQLSAALERPRDGGERNRRFLTAFVRPLGLEQPATVSFVAAIEQLAAEGARPPDPTLAGMPIARAMVRRLAIAGNDGLGKWLLMDAIDAARAKSELESERHKRSLLEARADIRAEQSRRHEADVRAKAARRRAREWTKWRRGLSARKQIARVKGGVKQLIRERES